jgi:hypothetical protein
MTVPTRTFGAKMAGSSSPTNGVWRVFRRYGLNSGARRLSHVAAYRAPYATRPEPQESRTPKGSDRASWSASIASTWRPERNAGAVWQLTAIDRCSFTGLITASLVNTASDGSLDIRPGDPLRCPATQDTRRTSSDAPSESVVGTDYFHLRAMKALRV